MTVLLSAALLLANLLLDSIPHGESISHASDTILLDAAVSSAIKEERSFRDTPSPISILGRADFGREGVFSPKGLNALVPGLHQGDYGASLTSSIYVRGFGSRMENPVLGLYVDGFPILDKNAYDTDYLDIASARMLRGPQGTLYGRNSMCGVLSLESAGPSGGPSRYNAAAEWGSANSIKMQLAWYGKKNSLGLLYRHSDGFFTNSFTNKAADPFNGGQLRWKWKSEAADGLCLENLLWLGAAREGGFAYGPYVNGESLPPSYNDEASYTRFTLLEGFKARIRKGKWHIDAMSSVQLLGDRMVMDQDYTPKSVFTLQQIQRSGALTAELLIRPSRQHRHWKGVSGAFGFFRANNSDAPVLFKRDGIQTLILDNANRNIPEDIGFLEISDAQFPVDSHFDILSWDAALFHESVFSFGKWSFTVGLRLEYEGAWMHYDSRSSLHYRFIPTMAVPRPFSDRYTGSESIHSPVLLPKAAIQWLPLESLAVFGCISKGFRSGGFNTQIFSDILQNRMMRGLMEELGVYFDRPPVSVGAGNTVYKPEQAWNGEIGLKYTRGTALNAQLSYFIIEGIDQQLTVFPPGMSTGRMMTNAGKSLSRGIDAEISGRWKSLGGRIAWCWNDARFVSYDDGNHDYAGKRIPYAPAHTLYASAFWEWDRWSVQAGIRGTGPIAWNEDNSLQEPFYLCLNASASVSLGAFSLYLRGENLSGTRYNTFYFKSMGREFFQIGKPARVYLGIRMEI